MADGAFGVLPTDLSDLVNPAPSGAVDQIFRAQVSAQSTEPPAGAPSRAAPAPSFLVPFGFLGSSSQSQNLLGDMWTLRTILGKAGITLSFTENAETFGNLTGGVRRGVEGNGLTTGTLQLDTKQAFGFDGGLFNVSGLHVWGGQLSLSNLDNLQTISGIEAYASLRLWELWYQQKFGDKFDIKLGEQSLDQEFMVSQNSSYFINAMMGWALLPTSNLPAGGPAYPLAGLGVRGRAQITNAITVLAGVFNGSPIPLNSPNSQLSNPSGISFPTNTGVLAIAELQYTTAPSASSGKPSEQGPLPGTYKIGAWYDSEDFDDQQYNNQGVPLASPASDGIPAKRQGNYSVYAVADQTLWRSPDSARAINAFIRPMFTTLQDRNLIDFSINGGFTLHQPLPGRDNDIFGVGFGIGRVTTGAANYDRQLQLYYPYQYTPIMSSETFLEATYQAQIMPWWQLQPDIQYVINPGAGIANPNQPYQRVKNELVLGVRTNITF